MPLTGGGSIRKAPTLGELRNPIALIRATRAPNDDWGFDKTLTPYWNGYARWEYGNNAKWVEDGVEEYITDVFTIRASSELVLQTGDFLVWNAGYYKVQATQPITQREGFIVLFTTKYETVSAEAYKDSRQSPPDPIDPELNAFWPRA